MLFQKPFEIKEIQRGDLPAFERRGCIAQELAGNDFIFLTLHSNSVDFHYGSGLPVLVDRCLTESRMDIVDTVLMGSSKNTKSVVLFDVLMVLQKSQRRRSWGGRLTVLDVVYSRFPEHAKGCYLLSRQWSTGLVAAFDGVKRDGGAGLLLRIPGKTQAVQCIER